VSSEQRVVQTRRDKSLAQSAQAGWKPANLFLVPMVLHRVALPWVLSRATLGSVQGAASVPERIPAA
jgi:hypothetical protein